MQQKYENFLRNCSIRKKFKTHTKLNIYLNEYLYNTNIKINVLNGRRKKKEKIKQ
jgi:hypothetical protein